MKTKTILTLFGLFFISIVDIKAQDFTFGVVAGFDVSNAQAIIKPKIEDDYRLYYPMISFNANGYVGYKSSGIWGVSIEPGFIQKGGVQKSDNDDVRIQMNYIQMPILADFYISDKLFVSVGPELAYMVSAKAKSKDKSHDLSKLYDKNFEVSGIIGLSYNVLKNFDIGLRYNHGLTNISDIKFTDQTGTTIADTNTYNQYFQFLVRFKV